jgi:citronellol/citronellal dehydrogenase
MAEAGRRLAGKVTIVAGASRGLGAACALAYGREGAVVVVGGTSEESGPGAVGTIGATAAEIEAAGGLALAVRCDVTDPDSVEGLVRAVRERYGRIDVLVNHAAVHARGGVSGVQPRHWRRLVDVNLHGAFLCSREVLPTMIGQRSGSIVNVSFAAGGGTDAVVARAVEALSVALATEQAQNGIAVNVLCADVRADQPGDGEPPRSPGAHEYAEAAVRLGLQTPATCTGRVLDAAAALAQLDPGSAG